MVRYVPAPSMVLALCLMSSAITHAEEVVMCPIMPDNKASDQHFCDYDGKRYYFCTDACVSDFRSDPSRFVNLPTVKGFPIPDADSAEKAVLSQSKPQQSFLSYVYGSLHRKVTRRISRYALDAPIVQFHIVALILIVATPFAERRYRAWKSNRQQANPVKSRDLTTSFRLLPAHRRRIVWALGIALMVDALYLASAAAKTKRDLNEVLIGDTSLSSKDQALSPSDLETIRSVHYSTFVDFGFPPRPKKRETTNALSRVYYRGNDERHAQMFNGGQYRTVTFRVHLEDEAGAQVDFGSPVNPDNLYMNVSFERAPNTSSGYYTSEYMKRMYLTMKQDRFLGRSSPVDDRTSWQETEPGVIWESRYKLPQGNHLPSEWQVSEPTSPDRACGVVYLVEERLDGTKVQGGRYHFGVLYDLRVVDGVIAQDSDLYMGTTYRGANFYKYNIKEEEWLSTLPIPEIPSDDIDDDQPANSRLTDRGVSGAVQ